MSQNTGECIVNSPIKVNCIDFIYDQLPLGLPMLEKRGDKKKGQIGGVYISVSKNSCEYILPISPKMKVKMRIMKSENEK